MRVHRGSVVAATWLIGLGTVFLVRQALGLEWGEAWPLFIIVVGVADAVSRLIRGIRGVEGVWSLTWPALWIVTGSVLLLSTTGTLAREPVDLVADAWPWVLVGLGIWFLIGAAIPKRGTPNEHLAVPLDGVSEADVRIRFGAGELAVGPAADGYLVDGQFTGGVVRTDRGPGRLDLEQDTEFGLPWLDGPSDWRVGLAREVPLDLRLDTGAARATLDCSDLRLRHLELHTGASETRIRLPRAAGETTVKAETGAAELVVEVPADVAARIRSRMTLGNNQVDEARFPRTATGYESPGFPTAPNRVELDLTGGIGSIRVVSVA